MLGLSVFLLVWLRLLVRLATYPAALPPSRLATTLARLMHYALYLMIGLPFAGWLILSAAGKPIPFFGLELPPLVDKNPDLAGQIREWHETGNAGYFPDRPARRRIFHHFVSRDNTLVRMLPQRR